MAVTNVREHTSCRPHVLIDDKVLVFEFLTV